MYNEDRHYANRVRGKVSRDHGKLFEDIIKTTCEYYAEMGIAAIEKTPEPMRPLRRMDNGHFLACFEKKAQPDFKGTLNGGGSVVFEAKHTDGDQIKQSAVTDEQAKRFIQHTALGATCFVLVSFSYREFARIPWKVWRDMKRIYGRKYITMEEARKYKVSFTGSKLLFLEYAKGI